MRNPTTTLLSLARRIKLLRLRRNWTRADLAARAHVNVHSLKRFERTGQISLERLLEICEALEVLHDFDHILKLRERVDIKDWKIVNPLHRKRGQRRSSAVDTTSQTKVDTVDMSELIPL